MLYRNTKTGVLVRVSGEISGDWELIPEAADQAVPEKTPEEKPAKAKKTSKKR